eukprot:352311-Chlamydomonas_euryale.AAC.3
MQTARSTLLKLPCCPPPFPTPCQPSGNAFAVPCTMQQRQRSRPRHQQRQRRPRHPSPDGSGKQSFDVRFGISRTHQHTHGNAASHPHFTRSMHLHE